MSMMSTMNPYEQETLEMVTEEELVEIPYEEQLLYAHNFHTVPKDTKFGDNRFRDDTTGYFCWRGITEIKDAANPNAWVLAEQCDPASYTAARTRFCLTFGCLQPFRYSPFKPGDVPEGQGQEVPNRRGGIIVSNNVEECSKTGASFINCLMSGTKESIGHAVAPEHTTQNAIAIGGFLLASFVLAYLIRKNKSKFKF